MKKKHRQSTINAMRKKIFTMHTPNENRIGQFKIGKNEKKNNCQSQMEQIEYVSCSFFSVYFCSFFLSSLLFSFFAFTVSISFALCLFLAFSFRFYKLLAVKIHNIRQNFPWKPPAPEQKNDWKKIGCVYRKWKQAIKSIYLALIFELLQLFA